MRIYLPESMQPFWWKLVCKNSATSFNEKLYNVRYVRVMVFPHPENFCYPWVPNKLSWISSYLDQLPYSYLFVLNEKLWSRASVTDREKSIK